MIPRRSLRPGFPVFPVEGLALLLGAALTSFALIGLAVLGLEPASLQASPTLTAQVSPEAPRAGQPFTLVIESAWAGPNGQYVLYPPTLTLAGQSAASGGEGDTAASSASAGQGPEASVPPSSAPVAPPLLEKRGMTQTFQSQAGKTTYRYEFTLVASTPGALPLGSISLAYRDMQAETADPPPAPLELELPTVDIQPGGARGLVGPVLGSLAVLLGVLGLARRFRKKLDTPPPAPPPPPPVTLEMLHTQARAAWVDGQIDRVWSILLEARPLLSRQEDFLPPDAQLEESRLRARYGGAQATPELERLVEALGRCVAQRQKEAVRTAGA